MIRSQISQGSKFHDGLAAYWNDGYQRGGLKKRIAFVRKMLSSSVIPGQRWLDAGCGGGILTLELSKLGARGLAVDGSTQMINAAIREVKPLCENFAFERIVSISTINIADASFDGVLCSSVVEYVDNVDDALFELNRVLKNGGTLILSVPNKNSLIRRVQKLIRRFGQARGRDLFPYLGVSINDFYRADLIRRLGGTGFRVHTVEGFDPVLPSVLIKTVLPPALYFVIAEKFSNEQRVINIAAGGVAD